ncbi:MAG: NADPH-dependent F420 reductase [Propionibacteriaceae bacterium]
MTISGINTIGFIGSGHIGSAVARLAVAAGYDVVLSNSRGPETLADLVSELGPKARAATAAEAGAAGDLVVVTVPFKVFKDLPVEPLAGKIVIDTNNYYPQRDGQFAELDNGSTTSASLLQEHLPTSHVVKAFNHIRFDHLAEHGTPSGTENRRALVIAGDDEAAKTLVTTLLDEFGFDTVDAGPLADSWRIEPGTPGYGPELNAVQMKDALASAERASA